MGVMTKLLERAIEKVRELPARDQDALANALLSITGEETAVVHLDDETRAAIEEGLAQAERGEFVPDEIVAEADKRDKSIKPTFRPHGAMVEDERISTFPTPDRVSLLTLDGRVLVPFRFGVSAEGMLQRRRGQCDLLYRQRSYTFFLACTVETPEP